MSDTCNNDAPASTCRELGNYELTRKLGVGGMGVVYLAKHKLLGRSAAIKVLLPELSQDADVVERFFTEARATSAIHHPGIVEIFDFGHGDDGTAFIVMEYLRGESIEQRLRGTDALSIAFALDVTAQIASALQAAHEIGIVHRDLKPDNVFLVPDPVSGSERTKILDFGIAKLVRRNASLRKTATGILMGTPLYMAPEQCRGAGSVDHRADLYSLGCMLFELLCSRPPFEGEGMGEVLAAHIHVDPPPPSSLSPGISPALDGVVARLLTKSPEDRYQSAGELLADLYALSPVAEGAMSARHQLRQTGRSSQPPTPSEPEQPPHTTTLTVASGGSTMHEAPTARRWIPIALVALLLSAGAGVLAGAVKSADDQDAHSQQAPPDARAESSRLATASPTLPRPPMSSPSRSPAPQEQVNITIKTTPEGAAVYRQLDGVRIGTTPLRRTRHATDGQIEYVITKAGFKTLRLSVPADRTSDQDHRLVALSKPPKVKRRRNRARRARTARSKRRARTKLSAARENAKPPTTEARGKPPATKASGKPRPTIVDHVVDPFTKKRRAD